MYVNDEPEHPYADASFRPDDAAQDGQDFTVEHAAGFLADVRDQWHSLDAADQEEASQAARELLDEIGAQLRAPRLRRHPRDQRESNSATRPAGCTRRGTVALPTAYVGTPSCRLRESVSSSPQARAIRPWRTSKK